MNRDKFIALVGLIIVFLLLSNWHFIKSPDTSSSAKIITVLPPEIKQQLKNSVPSATIRIPILMYHYVEYVKDPGDTIRKSLDIVPFVFENQLATLSQAGYNFITPSELSDMLKGKREIPPKPIILSFDDGYQDFYDNVFPLLKKYNARAVEYVISGFLDHPNFMYSWEVQQIATSGAVEIGAHTVRHLSLAGLPKSLAQYEIGQSKAQLEKLTGVPVVSFAYPSGSFDLQAENIASQSGFTTAVSTVPGIAASEANRYFLYRIRPGARMGQDLLNYLSQNTFKPY